MPAEIPVGHNLSEKQGLARPTYYCFPSLGGTGVSQRRRRVLHEPLSSSLSRITPATDLSAHPKVPMLEPHGFVNMVPLRNQTAEVIG